MADTPLDPRAPLDVLVSSPGREGLAGTAPANLYVPAPDREHIPSDPEKRRPEDLAYLGEDNEVEWR